MDYLKIIFWMNANSSLKVMCFCFSVLFTYFQDRGQGGGQAWYSGGAGGEGVPEDGQVRQVSIFEIINQKLLDLGIPRWNFGEHVEPIVILGFLIAMLFFGLRGLLFGGLLYAVVKMSQGTGQNQPRRR